MVHLAGWNVYLSLIVIFIVCADDDDHYNDIFLLLWIILVTVLLAKRTNFLCAICGSHSGDYDELCLLGHNAM
jgi:hypothetical protein